LKAQRE
jgi:Ran GTPase-activating protein (RanGAP) involved in mRNA processing and transport